jgi:hypothetical protein
VTSSAIELSASTTVSCDGSLPGKQFCGDKDQRLQCRPAVNPELAEGREEELDVLTLTGGRCNRLSPKRGRPFTLLYFRDLLSTAVKIFARWVRVNTGKLVGYTYSEFFLRQAIYMLILQHPVNFCTDENIQTIFGIKFKDFLNYRIDYNSISQTVKKVVKKII